MTRKAGQEVPWEMNAMQQVHRLARRIQEFKSSPKTGHTGIGLISFVLFYLFLFGRITLVNIPLRKRDQNLRPDYFPTKPRKHDLEFYPIVIGRSDAEQCTAAKGTVPSAGSLSALD